MPPAASSPTAPPSLLPATKTAPGLNPQTVKGLLYGPPKIGKSTLLANYDPDHTVFLATEPGLGGLEVYQVPIGSWEDFLRACAALTTEEHKFKIVVIDTVDELARMCQEYVERKLGVEHVSDAAYGKGWSAVNNEFRLKIAKLASHGFGMWFISHSIDKEIEQRVGKITKTVPTVGGKARDFVIGFVDVILLAESVQSDDGEQRWLRTQATERYEAGSRGKPIDDPLLLDAKMLQAAMKEAWK